MSHLLKIVILSVVQGLTEFLPVSSSGHLGLGQHVLHVQAPGIFLEVTTHAGTLLAVIVYYRKRLLGLATGLIHRDPESLAMIGLLCLGVVPVAILGLTEERAFASLFDAPGFIAAMLLVTGVILLSLYRLRPTDARPITLRRALLIGLAQAFALFPGISRSGITITVAQHLGIRPREAAEFSLLMMVPAIGGATLLAVRDAIETGTGSLSSLDISIAFVVSAVVGYAAICLLVRTLSHGHFRRFGFYCLAVGALAFLFIA